LPRLDEFADNGLDPFAGLAFAEYHFRKSAPLSAVQIDVSESKIGNVRQVDPGKRGVYVDPAGVDFF
jgi:hypothetical protein